MPVCIGEDVHSNLITCFAVPLDSYNEEELEFCKEFNREFKNIKADRHSLERMAKWLEDIEHCILIENSTKTHEVYWTLIDLGCTVIVANPADLYRITQSVQKTDYHDCEELAHYMRRFMLGEKEFSQCLMVDSFWMNRRQLCRLYAQASSDLSDVRRRIRSYMLLRGKTVSRANEDITKECNLEELEKDADASLRFLIENARYLNRRLEEIKKSIRREFKDDPMFGLIKSIPGFGDVTSSYLSSLIVDVKRFDTASQFAAYFGIVPKQRESAGHAKRCGITHRGDDLAREMLVKGTFGHIIVDRDRQSNISAMYDRLRQRGMPHKKALVACSNKMAHVMFAILKNGGPYEYDH